jgi:membrane-associated phospholipid phosphatase
MKAFLMPQHYSHRTLALWGASLLAAAALLTVLVAVGGTEPAFQPVDDAWYEFMRSQLAETWFGVNAVLDWLGYVGMVIYHVLILLLLLRHQRWGALFTVVAAVSVVLLTQSLKYLLDRERPGNRLIGVDTPSFPSGHTTATVAAVVATGFVVGRLWVWLAGVCVFVLMMLSRTYMGVHWLSDTVAGWLIGAGTVTLLWIWFEDKCIPEYIHEEQREHEAERRQSSGEAA